MRVGRVTKVHASEGAYVLSPVGCTNAPLTGTSKGNGTPAATATVTGFTAELDDAPVVVTSAGDSDRSVIRALIDSGTLTMEFSGNVDDGDTLTYTVYA